MTMQRLTESQSKLVEAHMPHAVAIARKAHAKYKHRLSFDEALSAATFGMVGKASRHDNSVSTFSTSSYSRAQGQILDDLRKKYHWMSGRRDKANKTYPHQFRVDDNGNSEEMNIESDQGFNKVDETDTVDMLTSCLTSEEKDVVVRLVVNDEILIDVAKLKGLSSDKVYRIKTGALQRMADHHGEHY